MDISWGRKGEESVGEETSKRIKEKGKEGKDRGVHWRDRVDNRK